jgi:hypothetical protein
MINFNNKDMNKLSKIVSLWIKFATVLLAISGLSVNSAMAQNYHPINKAELPVKIELGKEYYIRCSVTMGAFVGYPKLELIDIYSGKQEFEIIKEKRRKNNNQINKH